MLHFGHDFPDTSNTAHVSQSACAAFDAEKCVRMFVQRFKDLLFIEQKIILF